MQRAASVVTFGLGCASLVGGVVLLVIIAVGNAHDARDNLVLVAVGTLWPFWLSAAGLLASSFILHRRRGKRGFPVEPSVAPLPLGEVPSESASEAERACNKPS